MISKSCGRSGHRTHCEKVLMGENPSVARQGNGTETPQLVGSYETCVELRTTRFDETAILTGASSLKRLVKCQQQLFDYEVVQNPAYAWLMKETCTLKGINGFLNSRPRSKFHLVRCFYHEIARTLLPFLFL